MDSRLGMLGLSTFFDQPLSPTLITMNLETASKIILFFLYNFSLTFLHPLASIGTSVGLLVTNMSLVRPFLLAPAGFPFTCKLDSTTISSNEGPNWNGTEMMKKIYYLFMYCKICKVHIYIRCRWNWFTILFFSGDHSITIRMYTFHNILSGGLLA